MSSKSRWVTFGGLIVILITFLVWLPRQKDVKVLSSPVNSPKPVSRAYSSETTKNEELVPSTPKQPVSTSAQGKISNLSVSKQVQDILLRRVTRADDPDMEIAVESLGNDGEPRDTGELLDPDAEIPPLPIGDVAEPMDIGEHLDPDQIINPVSVMAESHE